MWAMLCTNPSLTLTCPGCLPHTHHSHFPDVQCALLAYLGPHSTPGEISLTCASLFLCPSNIRVSTTGEQHKNLGPTLAVIIQIPASDGHPGLTLNYLLSQSTPLCSLVPLWSLPYIPFCLGHPQSTLSPNCYLRVG